VTGQQLHKERINFTNLFQSKQEEREQRKEERKKLHKKKEEKQELTKARDIRNVITTGRSLILNTSAAE